ncbi:aldehyde dehydrogenase (NADP(+)) [Planotetraspora sp. A-T 1434]|uniref:aldehyde dehydrogenase (NADP(+)) n=1 Tax=Planotetraspora sp. A-T 1434 TaxID=2979219 RepID=UPI0021C1AAC5|nr:aldehyde dehydrogenase (NADP(+)) [Planotetraspora sp. A-T 1434]MCT9931472.1 aldehyde dehydrogenase (NADP(+)) [Planotetraspora sp. A-T 1434]
MTLTGELLIGGTSVPATAGTMKALNPATGELIEPEFAFGGAAEVDRAVRLADEAFDSYSHTGPAERAAFLDLIADRLDAVKEELAERASLETGLPAAQFESETVKSAEQFRKFAIVVRQGRFLQATIDPAQPDRRPAPRMDHRMQKVALGPVVIFGASNFPISYSVAGGDTASALAAGCPVVLKAHNAHPGTSELAGRVIQQAVTDAGLHQGVFSLVRGAGNEIGEALVDHPLVRAVTFTGSQGGGMALYHRAQRRPDPIPVFAEMTSVNPTFVLPAALAAHGAEIGAGFGRLALYTVGQMCLKPAILLAIEGPGFDDLRDAAMAEVRKVAARTMLTPGIHDSYVRNVGRMEDSGATRIGAGPDPIREWDGQSLLYEVTGEQVLAEPALREEVFGPSILLVRLTDLEQLFQVARAFRGQLSATMHIEELDHADAARLLPILERRTGRIVVNAFSIPQEVSYATVHGGPFPATSDSRFTSVGMSAIERFLRPVTYQEFPDGLLPESLREANPWGLWRLVDGELARD